MLFFTVFTSLTPAQEQVFSFLEEKGELAAGFTELETSHLEEVKLVMNYANYAFYILLMAVTTVITYYRKDKNHLFQLLNYGGKVTVAVMIFVGAFSLLFFDMMFTLLHKIFFPQGNWQFPAGSLLIHTFPLDFFVTITRNIFALTLFLGILFILSRYFYQYVLRDRN